MRKIYFNRPIEKIDKSIFIRTLPFDLYEKIVIDFEKSPHIKKLFEKVVNEINRGKNVLIALGEGLANTFCEYGRITNKLETNLDEYVKERRGVCLIHALLAGLLLEKLIEKGYLSGKIKICKSSRHAWTVFVDEYGQGWVFDISFTEPLSEKLYYEWYKDFIV